MTTAVRHEHQDAIGWLWLSRPAKRNALSHAMVDEALEAIDGFLDAGVEVAVLQAEGSVFCAGADVTEALNDTNPASERLLGRLMGDPLFWIAGLRGPALGAGVAIASVCPVVVCTDSVHFELPEHRLGLFPSGVLAYIEATIGLRRSVGLGLTGARLSVTEANACGLVNDVVPDDEFESAISRWIDVVGRDLLVARNAGRSWRSTFANPVFVARKSELDGFLELPAAGPAPGAGR